MILGNQKTRKQARIGMETKQKTETETLNRNLRGQRSCACAHSAAKFYSFDLNRPTTSQLSSVSHSHAHSHASQPTVYSEAHPVPRV